MGANPHMKATRIPLVNFVCKRLNFWSHREVSLRVELFFLIIFLMLFLSSSCLFLKIPVKVWNNLVRIQMKFLWDGMKFESENSWLKGSNVCKLKNKKDLGFKDLQVVNLALFTKWRLRLILGASSIYFDIL